MTIQKILLGFEPKRENLLKAVNEINHQMGCFDERAAQKVAHYFEMAPAAVYSAASFYDEIQTKKKIPLLIEVCDGANCMTKSADLIIREIESYLHLKVGDEQNKKIKIARTSCSGNCLVGPVVVVNGTVFERVTPDGIIGILESYTN